MKNTPTTSLAPMNPQDAARFDLWQHLHREHGLTLLEGELDEIVRLVDQMNAAKVKPSGNGACELTLEGNKFAVLIDHRRADGMVHMSESENGPFAANRLTLDELRLIRDWLNENL